MEPSERVRIERSVAGLRQLQAELQQGVDEVRGAADYFEALIRGCVPNGSHEPLEATPKTPLG